MLLDDEYKPLSIQEGTLLFTGSKTPYIINIVNIEAYTYTSYCWAQVCSQNEMARSIVPTREHCGLRTLQTPLIYFASCYKFPHPEVDYRFFNHF